MRDRIERALGVVKAFSVLTPGGLQVKIDVEAVSGVADSGDPEQDLVELIREIGATARAAQSGALFIVDEMHNLDAVLLGAVCMAFQAASRDALPVAMVGAGLPDLQVRLMQAKPYADRLFEYRELGRLSPPAARIALIKPASTRGLDFDEDAAQAVVDLAAGYPYFLQEYGRELWNVAEAPAVTMADVDEVRDLVKEQLARTFYGTRFDLASDAEQRYLVAMASLGPPPYSTAAVAARVGGGEPAPDLAPPGLAHPEGADLGARAAGRSTSPCRALPSTSSSTSPAGCPRRPRPPMGAGPAATRRARPARRGRRPGRP